MTDPRREHEIYVRVQAARDLLASVLDRRCTITDVGDGAIALITRSIAISEGGWDTLMTTLEGDHGDV